MVHRTGTAILKYNLLHHLTSMREAVLHNVLLDLQKIFNTLDQVRCFDILEGYGATSDAPALVEVLDLVLGGCEGWRVLQPPFPGIPWGNPW